MKTTKPIFRQVAVLVALAVTTLLFLSFSKPETLEATEITASAPLSLYHQLHLKEMGLNESAFRLAVNGWSRLRQKGTVSKSIISICDFTQSSNNKRLYIIDMVSGKLLFNTLVAHGKNTGEEFARVFSNEPSSYKSSLGFYTTKQTYFGEHGLSLKLEGEEPGFNDKAEERAIVMHGADYVCDNFICHFGRLGRSFGCPSVPFELHEKIINTIKDGTCFFVYYPDKKYLSASKLLR